MLYFPFEALSKRFLTMSFFVFVSRFLRNSRRLKIISTHSLSLSLFMSKFMMSGVDRIKQLFGMYALNLFLREVFMLRLAIKCISTSMGTVKNTLDKNSMRPNYRYCEDFGPIMNQHESIYLYEESEYILFFQLWRKKRIQRHNCFVGIENSSATG